MFKVIIAVICFTIVGLFVMTKIDPNLNSSDTIVKQRMGRLLRHKNPVLIVPYFVGTRDEELVGKMLENYNPKLVTVINNYKKIKI